MLVQQPLILLLSFISIFSSIFNTFIHMEGHLQIALVDTGSVYLDYSSF